MALKAPIVLLSFLFALSTRCVPLDPPPSSASSVQVVIVTQVVTSDIEVLETSTVLIFASTQSANSTATSSTGNTLSSSPSEFSPPKTTTDFVTTTATITPPPVTVTISEVPSTVTQIVTVTASSTPQAADQTVWTAPAQMTDLSCFNVSEFAYGQNNMKIVSGIPADASATTPTTLAVATAGVERTTENAPIFSPMWDNSSAVIQLFYPAGSINPASDPQGGADFYATPLDIRQASNVTLEYSVFFPLDFDWVLAGKLPGIYGGHETCSGGDDALECFSTRLMWREGGAGELYLYAPKDRQTKELCSAPPVSVCDQDYGLSIGRGAFNFTPGAWTHVKQTVSLNTPGKQDGEFALDVDGQEVMRRMDVFYRDVSDEAVPSKDVPSSSVVPPSSTLPPSPAPTPAPAPAPAPPPVSPATSQPSGGGLLGILGPLLNGLPLLRRAVKARDSEYVTFAAEARGIVSGVHDLLESSRRQTLDQGSGTNASSPQIGGATATSITTVTVGAFTQIEVSPTTATITVTTTPSATPAPAEFVQVDSARPRKPIGFTGLFFSSFFGGHEGRYASPKDQYTWFKDFSMKINN